MLESTKIKGNTSFIGSFGNTIINSELDVWDFDGAEIQNVVINSAGGFSNLTQTFFVNPEFTDGGVFYSTIQLAITAASQVSGKKVILVFPGVYDEVLTLHECTDIDIIGLGDVDLKLKDTDDTSTINLEQCERIRFKNFKIFTDAEINVLTSVQVVSLNNVSECYFENIKSYILSSGPYAFNFFSLQALYGPVFFDNINLSLLLNDTTPQIADSYIEFIKYDGSSSESSIKITNSTFQLYFSKTSSTFITFVYPLRFLTNTNTKYNFFINNCEFEYQEANPGGGTITMELIQANRTGSSSEKFDMVSLFNSFTNVDYHIDINSQNVLTDSNFKIWNPLLQQQPL
jgi:hypothetical protein